MTNATSTRENKDKLRREADKLAAHTTQQRASSKRQPRSFDEIAAEAWKRRKGGAA